MSGVHNVAQCAQKLVVLLDKVEKLSAKPTDYDIDDIKAIARELQRESEFVSGMR